MTDAQIDAAMAAMDEDGSGEIDFEEFSVWFSNWRVNGMGAANDGAVEDGGDGAEVSAGVEQRPSSAPVVVRTCAITSHRISSPSRLLLSFPSRLLLSSPSRLLLSSPSRLLLRVYVCPTSKMALPPEAAPRRPPLPPASAARLCPRGRTIGIAQALGLCISHAHFICLCSIHSQVSASLTRRRQLIPDRYSC
eukprot:SAG11_NODE_1196_length_5545_cov_17.791407_3_plen_193_part_00